MPISNSDPLLNQEVQVYTVESGGFLVRQMPGGFNGGAPAQMIDTYCVNMDAVADLLTQIYTPPPPPPEA
jgi:hypothetical protein